MNAAKEKALTLQRQGFDVNHLESIHMGNTTAVQSSGQQLVRVFSGLIGGVGTQVCDGRELHAFLKNGKQFSDWIKHRISQYGFEENQDFRSFSPKSEKPQGGRRSTEYHLSLDMAKELSMVENNEQGRAARRYFIAMEREVIATAVARLATPAADGAERRVMAFESYRIEFLIIDGKPWGKASQICNALWLGSSDRITRGLGAEQKFYQVRGRQRHVFIDATAVRRAADYAKPERAALWREWAPSVLAELVELAPAPRTPGLAARDLACLYAMCEAGDRLVNAHRELAPVHQAMRSNALIGVSAALETFVVGARHLRGKYGECMQAAAQQSGLAESRSPNLLGVQLCDALGEPPLKEAPPLQGEFLAEAELTPVQRFGLSQLLDTRLLVSFDERGAFTCRPVATDAVVVPLAKLPAIVADPFSVNADQLAGLLEAVTGRMRTLVSAVSRQ